MLKKILLITLICSIFGCGYEPLYLKKNKLLVPIKSWQLDGNKKINNAIISTLNLKKNRDKETGYELKLNAKKTLEVISKDKNGNPAVYRTSVIVDFLLNDNDKTIKQKRFIEDFVYNNIKNKFDLSQYQKNIEENLINKIAEKISIFLRP